MDTIDPSIVPWAKRHVQRFLSIKCVMARLDPHYPTRVQSAVPLPLDSGLIDAPLFHQGEPTVLQLDLVTFPSLRCATFRRYWHSKREGWGA